MSEIVYERERIHLMKYFHVIACVLTMGLAGAAQAAPVLYSGTQGSSPLVLELDIQPDGRVESRYFVLPERLTHHLNGKRNKQGKITLDTNVDDIGSGDDESDAVENALVMTLQAGENQNLKGELRQGSQAAIPVALTPVSAPDPATLSPFMRSLAGLSLYDYLFHKEVEPVVVKQDSFNGYNLTWWRDPGTSLTVFQLTSGYPAERLDALNATLRDNFWRAVLDIVPQCENSQDVLNITLLSDNAISYVASGLRSCLGAAHPYLDVSPRTLRVSDASNVPSLADLLWVADGPIPDKDAIPDSYLQDTLPNWLMAQFTRLYPQQMKAAQEAQPGSHTAPDVSNSRDDSADDSADENNETSECDYSTADVWAGAAWSLTPKGIAFHTLTPNLLARCQGSGWEVLPWDVVKQHPGRLKDMPLP